MVSDADQRIKEATDKANAVKAMKEHAAHSDADLTAKVRRSSPRRKSPT